MCSISVRMWSSAAAAAKKTRLIEFEFHTMFLHSEIEGIYLLASVILYMNITVPSIGSRSVSMSKMVDNTDFYQSNVPVGTSGV